MSFEAAQFSVLAYANGFTHWHYRSADPLPELLAPTYFMPAAEMLRPGDQITANLQSQGHLGLAHLVVSHITKGEPVLALVAASSTPAGLRRAA